MVPIYCVMFSRPISDEVRDTLFANAYLMITSYQRKMKVRMSCCEGVIKTNLEEVNLYGMNGVLFNGELETNNGKLTVVYLVRHQDLQVMEEAEYGAWLGLDEIDDPPSSKIRPNPLRAVAQKHLEN